MKTKMKMKQRSQKYDINGPRLDIDRHKYSK